MSFARSIKKALYAGGFFMVFLGIPSFVLLAALVIRSRPARLAPPPEFKPIEVQRTHVIGHSSSSGISEYTYDIVVVLNNPNARAGVRDYPVVFHLYDSDGNDLPSVTESSYILPGTLQYVMVFGVEVPPAKRLGRVEIERPSSVELLQIPETMELPRFSVFLQEGRERLIDNILFDERKGVVTNTGTFDWNRVEVAAVVMGNTGSIIGIGKTFVGSLAVGEQRSFTIQWPRSTERVAEVIIIPSTNMFRDDNIEEIIGDPSLLR